MTMAPTATRVAPARRQSRTTGIILLGIALFVAGVFAIGSEGVAVFRLSHPRDTLQLPPLAVPAAPVLYLLSAVLAFLGAREVLRGGGKWSNLALGIGLALLVCAFLVWATAGKSFSMVGMLQATMVAAVPIALGGLAGVLSERVAVVNIAIEGMLLAGAFTGALMGSLLGGPLGLVAAVGVGGLFGFILAALVVTYRVDQIIAGVVINLLVLGLTSYVSSQVFSEHQHLNNAPIFARWKVPL